MAAEFKFETPGDGRYALAGSLTFATVTAVLEESKELFGEMRVIELDLSKVVEGDSAGLALLLEWINWARAYGREIRYSGIPAPILAIARISEVEELLQSGEPVARGATASPAAAAPAR